MEPGPKSSWCGSDAWSACCRRSLRSTTTTSSSSTCPGLCTSPDPSPIVCRLLFTAQVFKGSTERLQFLMPDKACVSTSHAPRLIYCQTTTPHAWSVMGLLGIELAGELVSFTSGPHVVFAPRLLPLLR